MPDLKGVLAASYCSVIRDHFKNNPVEGMDHLSIEKQEYELYKQLNQYEHEKEEVIQKWANTPIETLNGASPKDIISNMEEFSDVFDLFLYMVDHADEGIPHIIIEKLKEFKGKAISSLANLAHEHLNSGNCDDVFIASVLTLGEFKLVDSVVQLIDLAYQLNEKNLKLELDHIEDALLNAGICTIEPILEILENEEMGKVENMLLYVLASVGSEFKNDRIYKKLRSAFRTMDEKMQAVICLNAYGDGRAVPMLRGYLERNNNIDRNLFYEIIGTIKSLGGRTDEFLGNSLRP